ncbi:alpha-hydroxy-acid oxidizing protein [Nocardia huaxiensis]|nr:alpha-hydroxy-acid oxidizing protein [Nocardia huaxiensis]UFS96856.1 alpha-hydroxy-acid oxidizing protein [Nocardia huaxiensis]
MRQFAAKPFRGEDPIPTGLPMTVTGLETAAREAMSAEAYAFVAGGAAAERTLRANVEAFHRYRIVPRIWRGTSAPEGCDTTATVFGSTLAAPVLAAPVGMQEVIRPGGEALAGAATAGLGLGSVLSTAASTDIETVGAAAGPAWWFQLYWPADDDIARSLVERAERAGARAIVVTADAPVLGWRPRAQEAAGPQPARGRGIANFLSDPVFRSRLTEPPEHSAAAMAAAITLWENIFGNHTLRPRDLGRLREWTGLPIVVKGVLHPDDARAVVDAGACGVVVSNHGGRQIDGSIAALDALPEIAGAVGDSAEVFFDSGVRTGSDIIIALALGAKAVLYGRPWLYGLALSGQDGIEHAFRLLLADLRITMGLAGLANTAEITGSILRVRNGRCGR